MCDEVGYTRTSSRIPHCGKLRDEEIQEMMMDSSDTDDDETIPGGVRESNEKWWKGLPELQQFMANKHKDGNQKKTAEPQYRMKLKVICSIGE